MGTSRHRARRNHPLHRPAGLMEESDEARALGVKTLILKRRRFAVAFRRTQDESDRAQLERIDRELDQHNIDIPAVQQQVALRKCGIHDAGQTLRRSSVPRSTTASNPPGDDHPQATPGINAGPMSRVSAMAAPVGLNRRALVNTSACLCYGTHPLPRSDRAPWAACTSTAPNRSRDRARRQITVTYHRPGPVHQRHRGTLLEQLLHLRRDGPLQDVARPAAHQLLQRRA